MATRTNRIVKLMRTRTDGLMEPIRRRISEEEQAKKDAIASLLHIRPTYTVITMTVPMRGTRFANRCA